MPGLVLTWAFARVLRDPPTLREPAAEATNVMVDSCDHESAQVSSAFVNYRYDVRQARADCFFGRCKQVFVLIGGAWRVARKKILLLNDTIPTVLDINAI